MFGKGKKIIVEPRLRTVFNIPSENAKKYLSSIIKDVNTIMQNEKFLEATKKVKLPENATIQDYENLVKRVAPSKIYAFLTLFIDECYDEVRRILSAIFVTDFELYRNRSINDMAQDIAKLSNDEIGKVLRFFCH